MAKACEFVGHLLFRSEAIRELGKDAGREGDVGEFDLNTGRLSEALNNGEKGVSREGWGFVGLGIDDLGHDILREGLRDGDGVGNAEVC